MWNQFTLSEDTGVLCHFISLGNATFFIKIENGPVKCRLNSPVCIAWGTMGLFLLLQVYGPCLKQAHGLNCTAVINIITPCQLHGFHLIQFLEYLDKGTF